MSKRPGKRTRIVKRKVPVSLEPGTSYRLTKGTVTPLTPDDLADHQAALLNAVREAKAKDQPMTTRIDEAFDQQERLLAAELIRHLYQQPASVVHASHGDAKKAGWWARLRLWVRQLGTPAAGPR